MQLWRHIAGPATAHRSPFHPFVLTHRPLLSQPRLVRGHRPRSGHRCGSPLEKYRWLQGMSVITNYDTKFRGKIPPTFSNCWQTPAYP